MQHDARESIAQAGCLKEVMNLELKSVRVFEQK
jgi:hypothetical protein